MPRTKVKIDEGRADRLKAWCEEKELTQQQIADALGITQQYVSRMFRKKARITITRINKLKKVFPEIDSDYIICGESYELVYDNSDGEEIRRKVNKETYEAFIRFCEGFGK